MVEVIYKSSDFIAVNKPAGLLTHPILNSKEPTLVDELIKLYPDIKSVGDDLHLRPGIVHRLDRDTSGLLVVARTQKFFEYFKNLLQKQEVRKTYLALVHGQLKPNVGVIKNPISLRTGTIKRTVHKGKMGKSAFTEYKVQKYFQHFSFIELIPKTGRTHQLRVHLAGVGHPIVGDQLYGKKENPWGLKRQFLHAVSIEFSLPNGSRIKLEADLPGDLQSIIDSLN